MNKPNKFSDDNFIITLLQLYIPWVEQSFITHLDLMLITYYLWCGDKCIIKTWIILTEYFLIIIMNFDEMIRIILRLLSVLESFPNSRMY